MKQLDGAAFGLDVCADVAASTLHFTSIAGSDNVHGPCAPREIKGRESMLRTPHHFGLSLVLAVALPAFFGCTGSESGGAGGGVSAGTNGSGTSSISGTSATSGTGGGCGVGKHDAGLGLCVDDSLLVIKNLSATLKPDQFGEYDLQLVFAASNTSTHAMSKCNGGSLVDDQGFHATVNISGSCGGGEVCPDAGSFEQICTLGPGESTGLYTLGVFNLPAKLPKEGAPITLTIKGFLDDATPVTVIGQVLVVK
jgi:hypothetical protein